MKIKIFLVARFFDQATAKRFRPGAMFCDDIEINCQWNINKKKNLLFLLVELNPVQVDLQGEVK